jgi:hypothetical protein
MHLTPNAAPLTTHAEHGDLEQERDRARERLERAADPYLSLRAVFPAPTSAAHPTATTEPAATTTTPSAALLLSSLKIDTRLDAERFRTSLNGTYFNADRAGDSHRAEHIASFEETKAKLCAAADTPEREETALRLLEAFRDGYVKRIESQLSSESRFYSSHISGPSNYPARRMEKRRDVADRKAQELYAWRVERVRRMLRIVAGVGRTRTTRLEEIRAKLNACETRQTMMTTVNAILRKHRFEDTPALRTALEPHGLRGLIVTKLLEPDACKRRGFADFEIRNNGASVRRWRAEVEQEERRLARADAQPSSERVVKGVRLEEHAEDNRLRLHFPGKPDADTIARLKRSGWRWSPSNGAWQRQLTNAARWNAEHDILGAYTEPQR